jgi:uncharacterized membrane protein YdcZ (DUF606 family)
MSRHEDLKHDLTGRMEALGSRMDRLERLWTWTVGLIGAVVLSAIVKLFVPGA